MRIPILNIRKDSLSATEKAEVKQFGPRRLIEVAISAENTGKRRTAAVAQLYTGEVVPRPENPVKELKRFHKFHLEPGEKQQIRLTLDERDFAVFDTGNGTFVTPPGNYRLFLGSSVAEIAATADIVL